jgi:hypothetical protein
MLNTLNFNLYQSLVVNLLPGFFVENADVKQQPVYFSQYNALKKRVAIFDPNNIISTE